MYRPPTRAMASETRFCTLRVRDAVQHVLELANEKRSRDDVLRNQPFFFRHPSYWIQIKFGKGVERYEYMLVR